MLKLSREWAMPNKSTFLIPPIKKLIERVVTDGVGWIDPFAGYNSPAEFTNDMNPVCGTIYHMDAVDFCKTMDNGMNGAIYDPPYSLRQTIECYDKFGIEVDKKYITTKFYSDVKSLLAGRVATGGYAICCGWDSVGLGASRGFSLLEVLLVCHGGRHYDTIVTVEQKVNNTLDMYEDVIE